MKSAGSNADSACTTSEVTSVRPPRTVDTASRTGTLEPGVRFAGAVTFQRSSAGWPGVTSRGPTRSAVHPAGSCNDGRTVTADVVRTVASTSVVAPDRTCSSPSSPALSAAVTRPSSGRHDWSAVMPTAPPSARVGRIRSALVTTGGETTTRLTWPRTGVAGVRACPGGSAHVPSAFRYSRAKASGVRTPPPSS